MPDWAFHWTGYTLAAIAGLLMLIAMFRDRARGHSRCRKCWYDLKEIGDLPITCPECGKEHTKPRHLRKTRRHKRLALIWLLVMVVGGYGLWVVPRVKALGTHGVVPTWVLILVTPWMDNDLGYSSWVYGIGPDWFAEHWFADQMEMRSEKLSKPVATAAYVWFRWCEGNGFGSKTSCAANPAPLAPQLRDRFLNQALLTRGLLEREVIVYCEQFIGEKNLGGSKSTYPVSRDWEQMPFIDINIRDENTLPDTWNLEWQERRGDVYQPHKFSSRGRSSSNSNYEKWEGDSVVYRVTLSTENHEILRRWDVVYEVEEGDHLSRMYLGVFKMNGDIVRGVPIEVRRVPLDP